VIQLCLASGSVHFRGLFLFDPAVQPRTMLMQRARRFISAQSGGSKPWRLRVADSREVSRLCFHTLSAGASSEARATYL